MRPWQRQEGQLSGASGDKRAEATTDYQLGLAGPLQVLQESEVMCTFCLPSASEASRS